MTFELRLSSYVYDPDFDNMGDVKKYKKLGFSFERGTSFGKKKFYWGDEKPVFIEINTLEELIDFYKEYGNLVIKESDIGGGIFGLEIYNGYRE